MSTTAIIILSIYALGILAILVYALALGMFKSDASETYEAVAFYALGVLFLILWPVLVLVWCLMRIVEMIEDWHDRKTYLGDNKSNWKI